MPLVHVYAEHGRHMANRSQAKYGVHGLDSPLLPLFSFAALLLGSVAQLDLVRTLLRVQSCPVL